MDKEPITVNGLNKLKEELVFLKEKKRPEIVAAIAEARSHGDLKENAEYHAAKEEQSHNEGRITEINDIIARANVIDVTKLNNEGKVIFGSTVFLEDLDSGEKINYKIVGRDEADLKQKLIFFQSPIGKGLIGKNKNDLVEIKTPAGIKNFEIKDVKYIYLFISFSTSFSEIVKLLLTHLFSICFNFNPNSLPSGMLYFVIKVIALKGNKGAFLSLKKSIKFNNFLSIFFDLKIWKLIKSNKDSFPLKYKIFQRFLVLKFLLFLFFK